MRNNKKDFIQQSIHISKDMKLELSELAFNEDRPIASVIRILIQEALDARKKDE